MAEFSLSGKRIWVAGHNGMVGSALVRRLSTEGCDVLRVERSALDLRRQSAVYDWTTTQKPDAVFLAAALVGGIHANDTRPAEFIHDNLAIELNVIEAARRAGVAKLMLLGSSCIYPRLAPQPLREDSLLTGPLEATNQWYAIAKIAGIKLCQAYRRQYGFDCISVMPTNLYGPGDNFDYESGHVVPALLRKMHDAKLRGDAEVVAWGTGKPRRELMHVDDMSDACVHVMKHYSAEEYINIGTGTDLTIGELAENIRAVVGFKGKIHFDPNRPDGTPRKLLDVQKLAALGWHAKIPLREGLRDTYAWFEANIGAARLGEAKALA
jgi:GDP-L-fucose synthase